MTQRCRIEPDYNYGVYEMASYLWWLRLGLAGWRGVCNAESVRALYSVLRAFFLVSPVGFGDILLLPRRWGSRTPQRRGAENK